MKDRGRDSAGVAGMRPPGYGRLEPRAGSVVAFHGGKGGVGATMLAAECAWMLASRGSDVVAIDADLERGCLGYYLDVPVSPESYSLIDLVPVIDELTPRVIENALSVGSCGARLLAAPAGGSPRTVDATCPAKLLGSLAERFSTVLVDTPPALDPLTLGFLLGADRVVFVVTPEVACLGTSRGVLAEMSASGVSRDAVDLVVNRAAPGDGITAHEIERYLGLPVALVLPDDARRCRRLGDAGLPVTSEKSRLGSGLAALADLLF
ncbi:MAG: hypothetical protein KKF41_06590 [Actinobacteria bacterium]|nr:hypothetical protein [Actinomycetota bacterium]MBU1942506.1 hypothetical protein [Actinomycetota bacterium]MBU2687234.1 hypothetical protein [Actinomycetota bacterium]